MGIDHELWLNFQLLYALKLPSFLKLKHFLNLLSTIYRMSDNQVKEMFAYLAKDQQVSLQRLKHVFSAVYRDSKPLSCLPNQLTKSDFESAFQKATQPDKIEQQLLYLFYQLDREKKGYLVPEDILVMFEAIGRKITLNEIENSYKYAKVYKNKMSFEDFKEYFHNF